MWAKYHLGALHSFKSVGVSSSLVSPSNRRSTNFPIVPALVEEDRRHHDFETGLFHWKERKKPNVITQDAEKRTSKAENWSERKQFTTFNMGESG